MFSISQYNFHSRTYSVINCEFDKIGMFLMSFIIRTIISDESRRNIGCLPSKSSWKQSAQKIKNLLERIVINYQYYIISYSDAGVQTQLLRIDLW
jgi:hypothetical protein